MSQRVIHYVWKKEHYKKCRCARDSADRADGSTSMLHFFFEEKKTKKNVAFTLIVHLTAVLTRMVYFGRATLHLMQEGSASPSFSYSPFMEPCVCLHLFSRSIISQSYCFMFLDLRTDDNGPLLFWMFAKGHLIGQNSLLLRT